MGCGNSQLPGGTADGKQGRPGQPTIGHPGHRVEYKLPMTAEEVDRVQKNWDSIRGKMKETGVKMFIRLFKTNDEIRGLFDEFRYVENVDELKNSTALENHALLVMNAIDQAIKNLSNEAELISILLTTGKFHTRFWNFSPHLFWEIQEPFIEAVEDSLDEQPTPKSLDKVFRKCIRFILQTLTKGYNEGKANDNPDVPLLLN